MEKKFAYADAENGKIMCVVDVSLAVDENESPKGIAFCQCVDSTVQQLLQNSFGEERSNEELIKEAEATAYHLCEQNNDQFYAAMRILMEEARMREPHRMPLLNC